MRAAGLAVGQVKWTERWIARAQRKADLRDERFRRHEEAVRAGTGKRSFMDNMEMWMTQFMEDGRTRRVEAGACANESRLSRDWPVEVRPRDLAGAWRTWVMDGLVSGPDGVKVTIWVRRGDQDLPFHDLPGDQARQDGQVYTVCVRRMPAGHVREFCRFAAETSARWYAVELARTVRQAGSAWLQPSDIFPERFRRTRNTSWRPGTSA